MWFLFDSHGYFEERSEISFFQALVAVFFNGGLTFLTTLLTLLWISRTSPSSIMNVLDSVGLQMFVYTFFSSFILWFVIAVIFYTVIFLDGIGMVGLYSILNMTGLGFVPLAIGALIELGTTVYFTSQVAASGTSTTTHVLIGGEFGVLPAVAMMIIHTITIIWSGHVWVGAIHQIGRLTPTKATITTGAVVFLLFTERVVLALM